MAKSTTKSAASAKFDLEKIQRFTEQELANLSGGPLPFCYQTNTGLIIGKHKVTKINDKCWQVTLDGQQQFDFFTRKDAIFYCIAMHKKDYDLAKNIKQQDALLGKLDFEAILFRHRYKLAEAKNDDWQMELYSNKYLTVMEKTKQVKKELQKSLNLAKYIKV